MQDKIKFYIYSRYLAIRKFVNNFDVYVEHSRDAAEQEARTKMAMSSMWTREYLGNAAVRISDQAAEEDYNEVFVPPMSQIHVEGDGYFVNIVNCSRSDKTISWSIRTRSEIRNSDLTPPLFEEGEENV